jgi:hypothetical protein
MFCFIFCKNTIKTGICQIIDVIGNVIGGLLTQHLEAGRALRLKLGQVQIPSGPHTVLRTTYAFESPRAEG